MQRQMELPWQIDDAIFAHFAVQLSVYVTCSSSRRSSPYCQVGCVVGRTGVVVSCRVAITLTQQRRDKTRRGDACNRPETLKSQASRSSTWEWGEMRALDNAVIYSGFVYLRFLFMFGRRQFSWRRQWPRLGLPLLPPLPLALASAWTETNQGIHAPLVWPVWPVWPCVSSRSSTGLHGIRVARGLERGLTTRFVCTSQVSQMKRKPSQQSLHVAGIAHLWLSWVPAGQTGIMKGVVLVGVSPCASFMWTQRIKTFPLTVICDRRL